MRAAALLCLLSALFLSPAFPSQSPDFNSDGVVDDADVRLFMAQWKAFSTSQPWDTRYDLNEDQVLDIRDVRILLDRYFLADGDRAISGTLITQDFRVGPGERVACIGDVVVQCQTATVEGELFSLPVIAAGASGGSITIQAQGKIEAPGRFIAGGGVAGASEQDGGNGGSVILTSATGDITLGAAPATTGVRTAQAGSPAVHAGDGGKGGDGLLGGAGGTGGSLLFSAPNGTLTFHQSAGLLHVGNGGHGGQAVVGGQALVTFSPPEVMPNAGGDAGTSGIEYANLAGVVVEDVGSPDPDGPTVFVAVPDESVVTGGAGGDAGAVFVGVDPETEQSTWPAQVGSASVKTEQAKRLEVTGANGGTGWPHGGHGGDVSVQGADSSGAAAGQNVTAVGGDGGKCSEFAPHMRVDGRKAIGSGWGGDARAVGGYGASGAECTNGADGGAAAAQGGAGGMMHTGDRFQPGPGISLGAGGEATAVGGKAGHGGDCCNAGATGTGGNGGKGGDAEARGGDGAKWLFWPDLGPGGDASAIGGNGGYGGRGAGAGGAGGAGGSAFAHGGTGHPPGKWSGIPGAAGQPGGPCPAPPAKYGTLVSYSDDPWLVGTPNLYDTASQQIRSQEVSDPFTLGGNANTLLAPLGRSVILKGDNSTLWAANEYGGIGMYSNPLTGGDRAPDRVLDVQSTPWNAIWYEEARDILYATSMITGLIYAWDGASTGDPGRDPDRTIQIADYFGGAYLTGAPGSDRLFVSVRIGGVSKILVYDNAHTASGAQAPDRVIEPTGGFQRHTLAWDACQDRLYFSQPPKGQTIGVINSASTREGSVDPDRTFNVSFGGMAADDWISALAVACAHDVLFVGMYGGAATTGSVLVYRNASTLEATPAPAARQSPDHAVLGLGVFKQ